MPEAEQRDYQRVVQDIEAAKVSHGKVPVHLATRAVMALLRLEMTSGLIGKMKDHRAALAELLETPTLVV